MEGEPTSERGTSEAEASNGKEREVADGVANADPPVPAEVAEVVATEVVEAAAGTPRRPARRSLRPLVFGLTITAILLLLFGLPWYTIVVAGAHWPTAAVVVGTAAFGA